MSRKSASFGISRGEEFSSKCWPKNFEFLKTKPNKRRKEKEINSVKKNRPSQKYLRKNPLNPFRSYCDFSSLIVVQEGFKFRKENPSRSH